MKSGLALFDFKKIKEGDLSITTDRRKPLDLRARGLPVKGGPPVHRRRPQCSSPQCKSPPSNVSTA